jgi:hypothetical protein
MTIEEMERQADELQRSLTPSPGTPTAAQWTRYRQAMNQGLVRVCAPNSPYHTQTMAVAAAAPPPVIPAVGRHGPGGVQKFTGRQR